MFHKYLTVARLIELLMTIPQHYEVTPNTVGNLWLGDAGKYVGYIDFLFDGAVVINDDAGDGND